MDEAGLEPGFRAHLLRIVDVSERQLDKLLLELMDHWSETQEDAVLRMHSELQRDGVPNRLVYGLIRDSLSSRRYAPRPLTERQIRRLIYG
jgi:hypothetical protein